jgi:hypothetical protein
MAEDAPLAQDNVDPVGELPRALQVPEDTVPQPPQTPDDDVPQPQPRAPSPTLAPTPTPVGLHVDPQNLGEIAPVQEPTVLPSPPLPILTPEPTAAVSKERTHSAPGAILYQSLVAPAPRTFHETLTPISRNASNGAEVLYETPATVAPSRNIYPPSPTILYSSAPIAGSSSVFISSSHRAPPRSSPIVFHSGRSGPPPAQYGQQYAHAGFAQNAAVCAPPRSSPIVFHSGRSGAPVGLASARLGFAPIPTWLPYQYHQGYHPQNHVNMGPSASWY